MSEEIYKILRDVKGFALITNDLFKSVDIDHTNDIDRYELKVLLDEFCESVGLPKPTDNDINDILEGYDDNGDLKISSLEFKKLIEKILKKIAFHFKEFENK